MASSGTVGLASSVSSELESLEVEVLGVVSLLLVSLPLGSGGLSLAALRSGWRGWWLGWAV